MSNSTTTTIVAGEYGATHVVTWDDGEAYLTIPASLVADVVNGHSRLVGARTFGEQAYALTSLSDTMSDLATWHPRYRSETGEIDNRAIVEDES
jgi:hypothetical protein